MKKTSLLARDKRLGIYYPLLCLSLLLFLVTTNARALLGLETVLFGTRLALLPLALIPATLIGLASFSAHFSNGIRNWVAWLTILVCAAMTITVFAVLNQEVYVYCTAPNCLGAQTFLLTENGQLFQEGAAPSDIQGTLVELDGSFRTSLYFSIVTFTTLGYGDMQPSPDFRLYAAYSAVLGYLYLGLIVGAVIEWGTRAHQDQAVSQRDAMEAARTLARAQDALNGLQEQAEIEAKLAQAEQTLDDLRETYNALRAKVMSGDRLLR